MKILAIYRQLLSKIGLWLLGRGARTLPVSPSAVQKIEKWISEKGWTEECDMETAADKIGVTREQLSAFFRHNFKQNFREWRKLMRIEEAKKMLLEDYSISATAVGESVGIADKSNFRRQFKEITGYTPSEWRLKH